jgi:DNA topoisomerase I
VSAAAPPIAADRAPEETAKVVGLRYVRNDSPGLRRRRAGAGFRYVGPDGKSVRDAQTLARIRALAVPPAWTDVWISPAANAHIQATGRDARGRKQYRYHARWREVRDETKYGRALAFIRALPVIRKRVEADLALPGLPRAKVLAAVVRLLERTFVRVGNEEYARENGSFGLTTLRNKHVQVAGGRVRLRFRGKSGKEHSVELADERLARIVRRCRDLPGYELFGYFDEDGTARAIDSADVNEYLRAASGAEYTAKDFRTWAGTMLAALALGEVARPETAALAKRSLAEALKAVAGRLGNTPAICRKCYVHPAVIECYLEGSLADALGAARRVGAHRPWSRRDELAVAALLARRLRREGADAGLRRARLSRRASPARRKPRRRPPCPSAPGIRAGGYRASSG